MAYGLAFPASITDLIYSYRDWRFEKVRKSKGTPTALAIKVAIKDLITMASHDQQYADAIENGEEVDYEFPEGYNDGLYLASFWWHAALEETRDEWGIFYPMFMEKFQALQQQREHILRQLYSDAQL